MRTLLTLLLILPLTIAAVTGLADQPQDWPQWRGPDRTGISTETGLLQQWPEGGPKKLWMVDTIGLGYSGPAIADGRLLTMGAEGETEYLYAVDAETGDSLWRSEIGELLENGWGDGPRGTPTVDGELVYAMSGQGNLVCAQVADGKVVWTQSMRDLGGKIPNWGYTESPLIDGDKVVCTPGGKQGTVAALNKYTGESIWQSKDFTDGAQYASIVVVNHNATRQYIQLTKESLAGLDAETGKLLWRSDWPGKTAVIPTPIFSDGKVFITSGYGVGCKLVSIGANNEATDLYDNKNMKNHHGGVILLDGKLYGYSDGPGWTCLDFDTGEIVWNEKRGPGKGAIAYADGRLYCLGERDGQVALVGATPEGWKEYGNFTLEPQTEQRSPKGKIWTHPVVVNGKLYLRDQELLFCYDVQAK